MVLRLIADKAQRQKPREYDLFRQIGLRTAHPAVSQSHASSGLSAARQPAAKMALKSESAGELPVRYRAADRRVRTLAALQSFSAVLQYGFAFAAAATRPPM